MVTRALAIALVVAACQGQSSDATTAGSGSASGSAPKRADAGRSGKLEDAPAPREPDDARVKPEEPDVPDPGKVIADLDAIPAWQAVIDRSQLLARRNQHGVVYGRVGPS